MASGQSVDVIIRRPQPTGRPLAAGRGHSSSTAACRRRGTHGTVAWARNGTPRNQAPILFNFNRRLTNPLSSTEIR